MLSGTVCVQSRYIVFAETGWTRGRSHSRRSEVMTWLCSSALRRLTFSHVLRANTAPEPGFTRSYVTGIEPHRQFFPQPEKKSPTTSPASLCIERIKMSNTSECQINYINVELPLEMSQWDPTPRLTGLTLKKTWKKKEKTFSSALRML